MRFAAGGASDTGRVRAANEDTFLVSDRLVAVADGMGGHVGGGTASAVAVESCARLRVLDVLRPDDVVTAVELANQEVVHRAAADPALAGMGTTLAGVAVVELGGVPHFAVFNVGDSRVYRVEGAAVVLLTVDHSEVQELVSAGLLSADDARVHPGRNVITRSLGTVPPPVVDVVVLAPQPSQRFLVCSDGLTNELEDREIAALLRTVTDPQDAADVLVAAALTAGGRDNVTVVVADAVTAEVFDSPTEPRGIVPGMRS